MLNTLLMVSGCLNAESPTLKQFNLGFTLGKMVKFNMLLQANVLANLRVHQGLEHRNDSSLPQLLAQK